jgi:hypothetical protein
MASFLFIINPDSPKCRAGIAYKGGGGGQLSQAEQDAQMRRQEELQTRQMELQQRYQIESEARFRAERDRERQLEFSKRENEASFKKARLEKQEKQEAATFQEMQGQTKEESSDFGGGFNLNIPTIDRPGYEQETRPS